MSDFYDVGKLNEYKKGYAPTYLINKLKEGSRLNLNLLLANTGFGSKEELLERLISWGIDVEIEQDKGTKARLEYVFFPNPDASIEKLKIAKSNSGLNSSAEKSKSQQTKKIELSKNENEELNQDELLVVAISSALENLKELLKRKQDGQGFAVLTEQELLEELELEPHELPKIVEAVGYVRRKNGQIKFYVSLSSKKIDYMIEDEENVKKGYGPITKLIKKFPKKKANQK